VVALLAAASAFPAHLLPSAASGETQAVQAVPAWRWRLLNFSGGQVMVMPKSGGEAIAAVPYKKILKATYTAARDPKWDASLPGPPEGLDVGTFMRTTRHWLVVQGSERFAILRLEDSNFRQILETFEARTGIKVERVK
jgi:hypothetical protein